MQETVVFMGDFAIHFRFHGNPFDLVGEDREFFSDIVDRIQVFNKNRTTLKEKNMDDLKDKQAQSRANLTDAGRRWEDLQAEYSNLAAEKFYEEYPDQRPDANTVSPADSHD